MAREYRKAKKEYMYSIIVGDYYAFKIFRVTDAALNVYWIGSPVGRGGTVLADKEEDIRPQLEKQVPILNSFLARVK